MPSRSILGLVLLLGLGPGACDSRNGTDRPQGTPAETKEPRANESAMSHRSIEEVQERHTPALMSIEGVVGTFIGQSETGEPCIKIMVRERTPELSSRLPAELEGYPVEIVESGTIRPLAGSDSS